MTVTAAPPVQHRQRFFAVIKDGRVIASARSMTRRYRYAVLYSRRDVIWRTTREGAAQQASFMGRHNPEILEVVETPRLLDVGAALEGVVS